MRHITSIQKKVISFQEGISRFPTYRLYYWGNTKNGQGNFGDLLSQYIVNKISGVDSICTYKQSHYKFIAVGSLINTKSITTGGIFWGTGLSDESVIYSQSRYPVSFRAVRGPLTRQSLIQAGYKCPAIFGDPALLLPKFYRPKVKKKYKTGWIPHYIHEGIKCDSDVKKISMLCSSDDVEKKIDEICECESVISSSLHGIIVANAYGIPAKYAKISDLPLGGCEGKKFSDYFLSVKMPDQIPTVISTDDIVTEKITAGMNRTVDLKMDEELLLDVFPYEILGKYNSILNSNKIPKSDKLQPWDL